MSQIQTLFFSSSSSNNSSILDITIMCKLNSTSQTNLVILLSRTITVVATIIIIFDKHHRMKGISHLISEFYPNPEMPSTLLKMKAVPSKAAFCKHGTTRGMSIRFRCFYSFLETVPSASATIITTTALKSHSF